MKEKEFPNIPNQTTIAGLRQWMREAGDFVNIESLGIPAANIEELLDTNWDNQLPRPKHEEIVMFIKLAALASKDNPNIPKCEQWIAVILTLMSQTLIPHSCITLNFKKGTFGVDKENRAKLTSFFTKESLAKQDRNRLKMFKKKNNKAKYQKKARIKKRNNKLSLALGFPKLPNEITLADLRQWMREAANTTIQTVSKSPEINSDSKKLLDATWKSKEPQPTPSEITALVMLSQEVGTASDSPDDWIAEILPLLSSPPQLHPYIKLNLNEASVQLDERVEVIDRRTDRSTGGSIRFVEYNNQKQ